MAQTFNPDSLTDLQEKFKRYGYGLEPLAGGYGVYQLDTDNELITFRPDLAGIEALLLTGAEVQEIAKKVAK